MLKKSLELDYSVGFGWGSLEVLSLVGLLIVIIFAIGDFGKRNIKSENMQLLIVIIIGFLSSIVIIWSYIEALVYFHSIGIDFNLNINIDAIIGTNEFSIAYLLFDFLFPGFIYLFIIVCCSMTAYYILFGKFRYFIYPLLALTSAYIITVNTFYISIISIIILAIVVFIINLSFFNKSRTF